jgi:outer membrane protein OmpA-like peptidoglycan-associated protein
MRPQVDVNIRISKEADGRYCMSKTKASMVLVGAIALAATSLGGCATKKFVNEEVAGLESRHGPRLDQLDKTSREALQRADAAGKLAEGKFVYAMTLSDDSVKFRFDKWELTPEGEAALTQLIEKLKSENKNVYIEIQGHTDSTGKPEYNRILGERRAEAVHRFLSMQGVALNRMSTISYGEDSPVAPNNTRAGRQANRRVVVVVLS